MKNRTYSDDNSNKKLKILFISSDKFPPFRVDSSVLFGDKMVARGHKIDWVLQSSEQCTHSYCTTWSGCNVWVGKTDDGKKIYSRLRKHFFWIFHQLKLVGLLRKNRYDFVQVKNKFVVAIAALIASKIYDTKFVYWLSFPLPEASLYKATDGSARYPVLYTIRGHLLKITLYKLILPFAHHIFVQSEQMKKNIAKKGISESKLTPVPMGVSLNDFNPLHIGNERESSCVLNSTRKSIVYIGTLARVRKMEFLVRVLSKVLKEEPESILYLVGDGDEPKDREILEKEAKRLGVVDSIIITGFLPREDALVYVNRADVCVSPIYPNPIYDCSSPTKLVEYMAMEKAVVANDSPDQLMVIEQSNAGICVPYNENAFAQAIVELLRDPERAWLMGKRGRRYVEQHRDYEKIADVLENKYFSLCRNKFE